MTTVTKIRTEEDQRIFEEAMAHRTYINEEEVKTYNLFYEHNEDIHPNGDNVYADCLCVTKFGFPEQSKEGIYDGFTGEILAKFNISSFIFNKMYFVHITNISSTPFGSVNTQFCSEIPDNKNSLPKSVLKACEFVLAQYPEQSEALKDAVLSVFSSEFIQPSEGCLAASVEKASLLYQLSQSTCSSYMSPMKSVFSNNLSPKYNAGFGRNDYTLTERIAYKGEESFCQSINGIVYERRGVNHFMPVTINTFLKDDRLFIQISELSDNEVDTCVIQFSSKVGVLEQSAIQQANKFICNQYINMSEMLLKVLSVVTEDTLEPQKGLLKRQTVDYSIHKDSELKVSNNLREENVIFDGSETIVLKSIEEDVVGSNYTPTSDMLTALKVCQHYYNFEKAAVGYDVFEMDGGIMSVVIFPEEEYPPLSLHGDFICSDDDRIELVCSYCRNNTFMISDYYTMFHPDFFMVKFEGIVDGEKVVFTYQTPRKSVSPGILPDCFIKAVQKYCELHDLPAVEIPFMFGVLMLSAFHANGEVLEEDIEGDGGWFMAGIDGYLKALLN
jgi:hypothetical protein